MDVVCIVCKIKKNCNPALTVSANLQVCKSCTFTTLLRWFTVFKNMVFQSTIEWFTNDQNYVSKTNQVNFRLISILLEKKFVQANKPYPDVGVNSHLDV